MATITLSAVNPITRHLSFPFAHQRRANVPVTTASVHGMSRSNVSLTRVRLRDLACSPAFCSGYGFSHRALDAATARWVAWFKHDRLHEMLGYRPPIDVELEHVHKQGHLRSVA